MPEIPPVIKNFIGTIPQAERADFLDWLKSQPGPAPVAGPVAVPAAGGLEARPAVDEKTPIIRIKEALAESSSDSPSIEISPNDFNEYIKLWTWPKGAEIARFRTQSGRAFVFPSNEPFGGDVPPLAEAIVIHGGVGTEIGQNGRLQEEVAFTVHLNPEGTDRPKVYVYAWVSSGALDQGLKGEIEDYLRNLETYISGDMSVGVPGWNMTGFHVEEGRLYFDFSRKAAGQEEESVVVGDDRSLSAAIDEELEVRAAAEGGVPPVAEELTGGGLEPVAGADQLQAATQKIEALETQLVQQERETYYQLRRANFYTRDASEWQSRALRMAAEVKLLRSLLAQSRAQGSERSAAQEPRRQTKTPFEVLGVPETASQEEIIAAYRELQRAHHPDAVGAILEQAGIDISSNRGKGFIKIANERAAEINVAYETLRAQRGV